MLLRGFAKGGLADLHEVHRWNLGFLKSELHKQYTDISEKISQALAFMEACGINTSNTQA